MAIRLKFSADTKQAEKDVNSLEKAVGNIDKTTQSAAKGAKDLATAFGVITTAVIGITTAMSALDKTTRVGNRIKVITGDTREFTRTLTALRKVSAQTGTNLEEAANLYSRLSKATKVSNKEAVQFTDTLIKLGKLSGSSTAGMQGALLQLGQALSVGVLRGDELNSVMEGMPGLIEALGKSLGKTNQELIIMGKAGKISSKQILNALRAVRQDIDNEFGGLAFTFEGLFSRIATSAKSGFGSIGRALKGEGGFKKALFSLADYLESTLNKMGVNLRIFLNQFYLFRLGLKSFFSDLKSGGADQFAKMIEKIGSYSGKLSSVMLAISGFGTKVKNVFYDMYIDIVGNSTWPDLVKGVISWAGKIKFALKPLSLFSVKVKRVFYDLFMYVVGNSIWKDMINQIIEYTPVIFGALGAIISFRLAMVTQFKRIFIGVGLWWLATVNMFSEQIQELSGKVVDITWKFVTKGGWREFLTSLREALTGSGFKEAGESMGDAILKAINKGLNAAVATAFLAIPLYRFAAQFVPAILSALATGFQVMAGLQGLAFAVDTDGNAQDMIGNIIKGIENSSILGTLKEISEGVWGFLTNVNTEGGTSKLEALIDYFSKNLEVLGVAIVAAVVVMKKARSIDAGAVAGAGGTFGGFIADQAFYKKKGGLRDQAALARSKLEDFTAEIEAKAGQYEKERDVMVRGNASKEELIKLEKKYGDEKKDLNRKEQAYRTKTRAIREQDDRQAAKFADQFFKVREGFKAVGQQAGALAGSLLGFAGGDWLADRLELTGFAKLMTQSLSGLAGQVVGGGLGTAAGLGIYKLGAQLGKLPGAVKTVFKQGAMFIGHAIQGAFQLAIFVLKATLFVAIKALQLAQAAFLIALRSSWLIIQAAWIGVQAIAGAAYAATVFLAMKAYSAIVGATMALGFSGAVIAGFVVAGAALVGLLTYAFSDGSIFAKAGEWIGGKIYDAVSWVKEISGKIKDAIVEAFEKGKQKIAEGFQWIQELPSKLVDVGKGMAEQFINYIVKEWPMVAKLFGIEEIKPPVVPLPKDSPLYYGGGSTGDLMSGGNIIDELMTQPSANRSPMFPDLSVVSGESSSGKQVVDGLASIDQRLGTDLGSINTTLYVGRKSAEAEANRLLETVKENSNLVGMDGVNLLDDKASELNRERKKYMEENTEALKQLTIGDIKSKGEEWREKLGFASGGSVKRFASGGNVWGEGTATSDSIPAMLSNGEFVVRESAARSNRAALDYLNSTGKIPGFSEGTPADNSMGAVFSRITSLLKNMEGIGDIGKVLPQIWEELKGLFGSWSKALGFSGGKEEDNKLINNIDDLKSTIIDLDKSSMTPESIASEINFESLEKALAAGQEDDVLNVLNLTKSLSELVASGNTDLETQLRIASTQDEIMVQVARIDTNLSEATSYLSQLSVFQKEQAEKSGEAVRSTFEGSLSGLLKGESSLKEAIGGLANGIKDTIADNFAASITQGIFSNADGEDSGIMESIKGLFGMATKGTEEGTRGLFGKANAAAGEWAAALGSPNNPAHVTMATGAAAAGGILEEIVPKGEKKDKHGWLEEVVPEGVKKGGSAAGGAPGIMTSIKDLGNNLITNGFGGLGDIFSGLFGKLGGMLQNIMGGGGGAGIAGWLGGILGGKVGGMFDNGGSIPANKFGIVGERGPEFVSGPARVYNRAKTARELEASGNGGGGNLTFQLEGDFDSRAERSIRNMVQSGMLQSALNGAEIENGGGRPLFRTP